MEEQTTKGRKRSPRTENVHPNESKADRFRRVGGKRVQRALESLRHVRSLANTASYEWTPDQRDRILNALTDAVNVIRKAFSGETNGKATFQL